MKKSIIFNLLSKTQYIKKTNYRIIYYHSIGNKDKFGLNPLLFEKQLNWLLDNNYKILTVSDLINNYNTNRKNKFVAISFDDGYEDNYTIAFKILKKYNIKATIYIITSLIGVNNIDDYQRYKLYPNRKILDIEQIKELFNYGIEIGSHSHNHINFAQSLKLNRNKTIYDIYTSKKTLENIINDKIISFSYPNGQKGTFNFETQKILQTLGFENAVNTMVRNNFPSPKLNNYNFPRIEIKAQDSLDIFINKIKGKYDFLSYYYNIRDLSKKW